MRSLYKPAGCSTASPYLVVDGESQTIEFLVRVFEDDEDERGGVKDAVGTTWWIATHVE